MQRQLLPSLNTKFLAPGPAKAMKMDSKPAKMGRDGWYRLVCQSLIDEKTISPFGNILPRFPDEALQRNTTSLSGKEALAQANGFYGDVEAVLASHGLEIGRGWVILDFGSCWGRISRFFMRDVPKENIHGLDVEKGFVDLCNALFESGNFSSCKAMPPCGFNDSSVDLVAAYSVFSHLSENAFLAWLREFSRILSRGGIVAFTTRDGGFLDYCAGLNSNQDHLSGYQLSLATAVGGDAGLRERYRAGEFVFVSGRGMSGGGSKDKSFYGESFIPRAYVEKHVADEFELLDCKSSGQAYDQSLFVLRKRSKQAEQQT